MKKNLLLLYFCIVISPIADAQVQLKIDSLKQVLKDAKEDTGKINTLYTLSMQIRQTGNYDDAIKYANEALALSDSITVGKVNGWEKGKARSHLSMAIIYLETAE